MPDTCPLTAARFTCSRRRESSQRLDPRGYQLINAAEVMGQLSAIADKPANEAQARELAPPRAERKAGEPLAEMPKQDGGDAKRTRSQRVTESPPPPRLAELGISYMQSSRWQAVAAQFESSRRRENAPFGHHASAQGRPAQGARETRNPYIASWPLRCQPRRTWSGPSHSGQPTSSTSRRYV